MTSNHDHAAGLKKLRDLAPGIPYSGCTTCMGVMEGRKSMREDATTVAIWAISDAEGTYTPGYIDLDQETNLSPTELARGTINKAYKRCYQKERKASFVWVNTPPGPEDELFRGLVLGMGDIDVRSRPTPLGLRALGSVCQQWALTHHHSVLTLLAHAQLVGGSSADNSVSGDWRQWTSAEPDKIFSNSAVFVICHCSAQVQGALQTGYNASPSYGVVTELHGPRHIKTIDNVPAGEVYNTWCNGYFEKHMKEDKAVILGPSSIYPLGQVSLQNLPAENPPISCFAAHLVHVFMLSHAMAGLRNGQG